MLIIQNQIQDINDPASDLGTSPLPPQEVLPVPTRQQIKEVEQFLLPWLKASAEYVTSKLPKLKLCRDLFYNTRRLSEFDFKSSAKRLIDQQIGSRNKARDGWHADIPVSPAPWVGSIAQRLHSSIFAMEEYCQILPEPGNEASLEDEQFPTSKKIQGVILRQNQDMKVRVRAYQAVRDMVMLGTVVIKAEYYEKSVRRVFEDPVTGQRTEREDPVSQGTVLHPLDLARWLPDRDATTSDPQMWHGIGDRQLVSWDKIKGRFGKEQRPGPYNVNREKFFQRWKDGEEYDPNSDTRLNADSDQGATTNQKRKYLMAWEYHGEIPFSDGTREVVATVLTGPNAGDDPSGGILVRLQLKPVLEIGLRPYAVCHFEPGDGAAFGAGIIELNLDLLYYLSHLVCLYIDAVRLTSIPMLKRRDGGGSMLASDQEGDIVYPGKIWRFTVDADDIQPFGLQAPDLRSLVNLIQYFERVLEKRTTVSDATRGLGQSKKTATEAASLMQASDVPLMVLKQNLNDCLLEPFSKFQLSYFKRRMLDDQEVWVKGSDGMDKPVVLTVQEIRSGRYRARWPMDDGSKARISKAQTIQQILPVLDQLERNLLLWENQKISRAGLVKELLRTLEINQIDEVLQQVDDQERTKRLRILMPNLFPPQPPPDQGPSGGPPSPAGIPPIPKNAPEGGPMGPEPGDLNQMAREVQMNAINAGPVIPGQGPA